MGGSRSWQRRAIHLFLRDNVIGCKFCKKPVYSVVLVEAHEGSDCSTLAFTRSLCPLFSGWNAEEGINAIPRRSERCVQNSLYARFLLFNRMNISGTSTASFDARFSGAHRSGSTAFLLAFLRCKTEEEACFDFEFHFLQSRTSLIQARIDFKFHLLKSRSL